MAHMVTLGQLITPAPIVKCGEGSYPVLSMTMRDGIVLQSDRFKKSLASTDQSNYKVVRLGQLVVGFPIDEGVLYVQKIIDEGIMSPAYNVWNINTNLVDADYLELALHSPYAMDYYKSKLRGTTARRRSLPTNELLALPLLLPDFETQVKIVSNCRKANELIALRKEQLAKLDQLVKSRFIELFDNSDYPSEPLDNNVVEMFIGPFGSSLKNECFVDEEEGFCMVYEQKHAIQKMMNVPTRYVPKSKYEELKRFTVVGGDIIVSCRGTIGEIFIVPEDAPMGIMHPSIMKIRLDTRKYNQKFFVFALEQYMDEHSAEAKGSGVKMAVSATVLGQSDFVVPPIEIQNQFAAFVEQTDKSKLAIQQSLDKLELLKKSLMQEYFG